MAQAVKYNENYSIACHNCYEPQYATGIDDIFPYTNNIEIDIWDSEIYSGIATDLVGGHRMNQDWYVKHKFNHKGNLNCFGGNFRDCLKNIKNWSDKNPNHNVITIFIDKEENWSDSNESRKPNDLDELILSIFTRSKIFTFSELLVEEQDLKAGALKNWPNLDMLKHKFIFIITDANAQINTAGRKPLNEYLESQKGNAVCFVAPEISSEDEILNPKGISKENSKNVVFYNLSYNNSGLSEKINSLNCVSRVYGSPIPETVETYKELISKKVNFIAMFNYKLKI